MPLQQINWLQIDTVNVPLDSSGSASYISLGGSGSNYLDSIYVRNLYTSGSLIVSGGLDISEDLVVGGNLTVKGTTTTVNSTTIDLGDNIISLNGSEGSFGGLYVNDPTNPNKVSGSLVWDSTNDYWIAGPSGSEEKIALLSDVVASANSNVWQQTGSFWAATSDLQMTGSVTIKGDLRVEGKTTLVQTLDPNVESLVVSGALKVVKNEISSQIVSASIKLQDVVLAEYSVDRTIIDCGDGLF
jgi:hypothetical protein